LILVVKSGIDRVGKEIGKRDMELKMAIERLKKCYAQDRWPMGYEEMRTFDSMGKPKSDSFLDSQLKGAPCR
jgi:hypothetical protein